MKITKLENLLSILTVKELKQLNKYMESSFFVKRGEVIRLFQYIYSFAPNIGNAFADKEKLFAAAFPDKAFDSKLLSRVLYETYMSTEDGFKQVLFNKTQNGINSLLSKEYYLRGAKDLMGDVLDTWRKDTEILEHRSFFYYQEQLQIEKNKMLYDSRFHDKLHDTWQHSIEILFIAETLKLYAIRLSNQQIYQVSFEAAFYEMIFNYVKEQPLFLEQALVGVFYQIIACIKGDDSYFPKLLQHIDTHQAIYTRHDLDDIYSFAQNICAIAIRNGKKLYFKHLFDLYKAQIANETIYNLNGAIGTAIFKNIITVALLEKEYAWALTFLEANYKRLPPNERDDVYQYNLANILFQQQKYQKVILLLNEIAYTDDFYKISARILRLKTYYEIAEKDTTYLEVLQNDLSATKLLVYRLKNVVTQQKKLYLNFIKFLDKLLQLPPKRSKEAGKLLEELTKSTVVLEKRWLLEKIDIKALIQNPK